MGVFIDTFVLYDTAVFDVAKRILCVLKGWILIPKGRAVYRELDIKGWSGCCH